jgi:hypothetical protein
MPISTAVAVLMQVSKADLVYGMQWVNTLVIIINQKEAQINLWKRLSTDSWTHPYQYVHRT